MARFFNVKIISGLGNGPYSIHWRAGVTEQYAIRYSTNLPATGVTYNDLTSINGVKVMISDSASTIFVVNDSVGCGNEQTFTLPTPTPTPTSSITPTRTVTPTVTPSISVSVTATVTPTRTVTPTITPTVTPSLSISATPTITPTRTVTPTVTPSLSISATPTITPTRTITPTITPSLSISATPTITPTRTITPTVTPTVTPSLSISATPTVTPSLSISATPTITPTITPTRTVTPSITPSLSISVTPTITPTVTPSLSISATPTITPTRTITPTVTPSLSISATPSLSISATPTITPTRTITPTVTPSLSISATPTVTPTITPSLSISATPTITPTRTVTPTVTPSLSISATPTITPTITPSLSISVTPTVTPSLSISATPTITPTITPSLSISVTPTRTVTPTVTPSSCPCVEWEIGSIFNNWGATYTDCNGISQSTSNVAGNFNNICGCNVVGSYGSPTIQNPSTPILGCSGSPSPSVTPTRTVTPSSNSCPAYGTFIRYDCGGTTRYTVVSNGSCGETWINPEQLDGWCGYSPSVTPSVTPTVTPSSSTVYEYNIYDVDGSCGISNLIQFWSYNNYSNGYYFINGGGTTKYLESASHGVRLNQITTTSPSSCTPAASSTPTPTPTPTPTSASRYTYLVWSVNQGDCSTYSATQMWSYNNIGDGYYYLNNDFGLMRYLISSSHSNYTSEITNFSSTSCTPSVSPTPSPSGCPAYGTFIRMDCIGTTRYEVRANGSCGELWVNPEQINGVCGYCSGPSYNAGGTVCVPGINGGNYLVEVNDNTCYTGNELTYESQPGCSNTTSVYRVDYGGTIKYYRCNPNTGPCAQ